MIPLALKQVAEAIGARSHDLLEHAAVRGVSIDTRTLAAGDLFFALQGQRCDGHTFAAQAVRQGAVACVCTHKPAGSEQASPIPWLQVDDTVGALARLAAYYRTHVMPASARIVAVTGSNGKTTTKCMIDHVLGKTLQGRASPKSFNNHLGVPLTLLSVEADDRYVIAEIGSNAPGEVAALGALVRPDVAVITSIGEAHLERLGDLSGVAAEKCSLLDYLQPAGLAVVNTDCQEIRPFLDRRESPMNGRLLTFGQRSGARLRCAVLGSDLSGTTFELEQRYRIRLRIPGTYQAANATAAFAVARWFGLDPAETIRLLEAFEPREGRAKVYNSSGVTVVDDSYNANPTSMEAAIEALRTAAPPTPPRGGMVGRRRRVMVMGDMLELGGLSADRHARALRLALGSGIDVIVLVGERMAAAFRSFRNEVGNRDQAIGIGRERDKAKAQSLLPSPYCLSCEDAESAADALKSIVSPGDVVWVKGSRAIHLESVVESLRAHPDRQAAVA